MSPSPAWPLAFAFVACVLILPACGGDEPDEPAPADEGPAPGEPDAGASPEPEPEAEPEPEPSTGDGWIELGTGFRTFEPLEPGQQVPIIMGIQGGYHVWGGIRGGGFDDSDVRLRFQLDLDGATIARADYAEFGLPPDRRDPSLRAYPGVAVIYDDNDRVQPTSGRTMTLRVEVRSNADGQVMTDETEVVPVCCQ